MNNELAQALCKAQQMFRAAKKDNVNPYFNSKYASLSGVWDAIVDGLGENGLAVLQPIQTQEDGRVFVETILMHQSGQSISSHCPVLTKDPANPQAMGSAITYARRYSLAALLGVVIDDDDGIAASTLKATATAGQPTEGTDMLQAALTALKEVKNRAEFEGVQRKYFASCRASEEFINACKTVAQKFPKEIK